MPAADALIISEYLTVDSPVWTEKIRPGICSECMTTESPIWRRGPTGKKLCNACGLRFSKRFKIIPAKDVSSCIPVHHFVNENDNIQPGHGLFFGTMSCSGMKRQIVFCINCVRFKTKCTPLKNNQRGCLQCLRRNIPCDRTDNPPQSDVPDTSACKKSKTSSAPVISDTDSQAQSATAGGADCPKDTVDCTVPMSTCAILFPSLTRENICQLRTLLGDCPHPTQPIICIWASCLGAATDDISNWIRLMKAMQPSPGSHRLNTEAEDTPLAEVLDDSNDRQCSHSSPTTTPRLYRKLPIRRRKY